MTKGECDLVEICKLMGWNPEKAVEDCVAYVASVIVLDIDIDRVTASCKAAKNAMRGIIPGRKK